MSMSSNMDYLLSVIHQEIPEGILVEAFSTPYRYGELQQTLDYQIKTLVIKDIVLRDCNVVAGETTVINIDGCVTKQVENGLIIDIGFDRTGGKQITSVFVVGINYPNFSSSAPSMVQSLSSAGTSQNPRVYLIDVNKVYIEGYGGLRYTYLRCVLSNDPEFGNIQQRQLLALGELVTAACKAYVYNKLVLNLANAVVSIGIDKPKMKEIVDQWADHRTIYKEKLKVWRKVAILGDPAERTQHWRRILPLR